MDRLEGMSTFVAVVEAGSLSAAARRLNTPLATVSRKVSELELHLRTSFSIGRAASWYSPMRATPMSLRASASSRMLRRLSGPPPASIPRRPAS